VLVRKGRFGPYVQHGNMVANLPRDLMMDDITLAQATELLAGRGKILKPKGARKGGKAAKAKPSSVARPATAPKQAAASKTAAAPKTSSAKAKPAAKAKAKASPPRRRAAG
jgi:DNA topoisomerase-1